MSESELKAESDVKWVKASDDFITRRDERLVIALYRFVRTYYQFFFGLFLGLLVMGLIVK